MGRDYSAMRARGLCTDCGKDADGRARCLACARKKSKQNWTAKHRANGGCAGCKEQAVPGQSRCARCATKHADKEHLRAYGTLERSNSARVRGKVVGAATYPLNRRQKLERGESVVHYNAFARRTIDVPLKPCPPPVFSKGDVPTARPEPETARIAEREQSNVLYW